MIKHIKKNDTEPIIKAVLMEVTDEAPNGTPVDLTGASVKFIMKQSGATSAKVDAAADITDEENGEVQYEWVWDAEEETYDTDTEGDYLAEFEVTKASGKVCTWWDFRTPGEIEDKLPPEPLIIRIVGDLG